ncbi:MAG TPA: aminoglycoside 6-adenylyltransferase [Dehalococcoidia bacterium]|nr:aminoglycoside 6-adenylyltransferase [Dehalococcoidia bacterium]
METNITKQLAEIPPVHRDFLLTSVEKLKNDNRILGVAIGGSFISGHVDEYSDLDLVVVVAPEEYQKVLDERKRIAKSIGPLLEAFTAEHVGEPRLLVCLYGPPLIHVDLKFVSMDDAGKRVENPVVIWERDAILTKNNFQDEATYPVLDIEWIEERFWVWVHYLAAKIGRGELFEIIDGLGFIRSRVLGPMILTKVGARPQGVRKIEECGDTYVDKLQKTVPAYDKSGCISALDATIELYRELRKELRQGVKEVSSKVEFEAVNYFKEIEKIGIPQSP